MRAGCAGEEREGFVTAFGFYDAFYLVNDFDVDNFNRKQLEHAQARE